MIFSFSGRHMDVGESLTNKAREDCENLAKKYGTGFIEANIVMSKDGHMFITDISVKTESGNSYRASEQADDPKVSFEITLQKINLQMQKKKKSSKENKEKMQFVDAGNIHDNCDCCSDHPMIIAEILDDLPLMSVNEAAEHLSKDKKIFVFANISTNAVNVVYLRDDGNIGWIDYNI